MNAINASFERLVAEGRVGITGQPWSSTTERRKLPDCQRSGCHRPARNTFRTWHLCDPCYDAIVAEVF